MSKSQEPLLQLEFDAGNTRIKWRLRRQEGGQGWHTLASDALMAPEKIPSAFLRMREQFNELPLQDIDRVLVASVRGPSFQEALSSFLFEKLALSSEFVVVSSEGVPLRHCYEDDTRLGVDRWLAMLAAYTRCRESCVVIDCGTTITVDMVDAKGVHLGGYIVPGLQMMRGMLSNRSRALAAPELPFDQVTPGRDTASAIHHGILAMVSSFVHHLPATLPPELKAPRWYLTGGDAPVLLRYLEQQPVELVPDLVLDGLMLAPHRS